MCGLNTQLHKNCNNTVSYYPRTKPKSVRLEGCIGKSKSQLARDKAKIKYISGRQSSPHEVTFGIELGANLHSKKKYVYSTRYI